MINLILDGYFNPAIKLSKHLVREMKKSDLTTIEFFDSLLLSVNTLKIRIENDFYKSENYELNCISIHDISTPLIHISGHNRHIKYQEILDIIEMIECVKLIEICKPSIKNKGLTHQETALKLAYEKTIVTRKTHGDSIYNKWIKWCNVRNRIANDGSDLMLRKKIKMFEKVAKVIDKPSEIHSEIGILKSYLTDN